MGRNVKEMKVPINGAIYRNSSQNGLIIEADGGQYMPSTSYALITNTDYPKYVALNSQTSAVNNVSVSSSSSKNYGTVVASPTTLDMSTYIPYMADAPNQQQYPFCGRTGKYRYLGMTGTNGTNVLVNMNPAGYKQSGSNSAPAVCFNATTGAFVGYPSRFPIASWYDSSTSLFRCLASPFSSANSTAILYTSTNGDVWSQTTINGTQTSTFSYNYFGGRSGFFKVGSIAVNQKVFVIQNDSSGSEQCVLFCSSNGGATVTDRSTAVTGTATTYFNTAGTSFAVMTMNYDGTTLFIPSNTSNWRYSTNDGVNFSNTTISGVTTSPDQNPVGIFSTGNYSSTFMMIYNTLATSNRVYVTTNGGQSFTTYNWTPAATISGMSYGQACGDYDSANSRWCFAYQTVQGWYAARSTDNGATWTHSQIQDTATDTWNFNMVFLGGAWYAFGGIGLWKSTNASTWTKIHGNNSVTSYGQPYFELNDYVIIGKYVIKKSDNSYTAFNPDALVANPNGYMKSFGGYLNSDSIVQIQAQYSQYLLVTNSTTAATANNYSPYPYSNQQTGTGGLAPIDVEYWRIK